MLAAKVIADGRTYLNVDRLYTLWQMVQKMPGAAGAVAEVGVYKGGSARLIAEALRRGGREIPFFACDTFQGHAEVDETVDGRHRVGDQFRHVKFEKVRKYLAPFPFVRVVQGNIRDTAPGFASEHAFGFVHLDVDVYPITRFCLEFFVPRLVAGGVIVVDDYGSRTCQGVSKAVDEFAAAAANLASIHLLTGQAVLIRLS
jgi:predicted O-methyltransferase YrrM